jgi:hypothetical protein
MGKTIVHRLDEACRNKGYAWVTQPDEPVTSPPYKRWWGAIVEDRDHAGPRYQLHVEVNRRGKIPHVVATVSDLPGKTAMRELLRIAESLEPR